MSDKQENRHKEYPGHPGDYHHRKESCGPGRRIPWPLKVLGGIVFIPAFLFLGSWATMLLWNALLPDLFGISIITFWQAMGILVLGRLVFGGRHGGPGHGGFRKPRRPRFKDREAWRNHLRDRFEEDARHHPGPGGPRYNHGYHEADDNKED